MDLQLERWDGGVAYEDEDWGWASMVGIGFSGKSKVHFEHVQESFKGRHRPGSYRLKLSSEGCARLWEPAKEVLAEVLGIGRGRGLEAWRPALREFSNLEIG